MSKLKFLLAAGVVIGMFSVTSCKKTTNNTTVVQDSIYYSAWIPLNMQLTVDPSTGDTLYVQQITAPAITSKIVSRGAVVAYYGYPASAGDTVIFDEAEVGNYVGISYSTGSIQVEGFNIDLSYSSSGGYLFRYVVIPGNVLTTSFNGMTQQQLNKMSFTDLQKAINTAKQTSGNSFTP